MNEIIEDVDGFYYFNEEDDLVGPFKKLEQAQFALNAAHRWSVREHKDDIRKMRDYYE